MKFIDFINMYDGDGDDIVRVNSCNLGTLDEAEIHAIVTEREDLHDKEVIAFGFDDNILTVKVR